MWLIAPFFAGLTAGSVVRSFGNAAVAAKEKQTAADAAAEQLVLDEVSPYFTAVIEQSSQLSAFWSRHQTTLVDQSHIRFVTLTEAELLMRIEQLDRLGDTMAANLESGMARSWLNGDSNQQLDLVLFSKRLARRAEIHTRRANGWVPPL